MKCDYLNTNSQQNEHCKEDDTRDCADKEWHNGAKLISIKQVS